MRFAVYRAENIAWVLADLKILAIKSKKGITLLYTMML